MHRLAGEMINAFDLGPLWYVELSDCAYEEVTRDSILRLVLSFLATLALSHSSMPFLGLVIPSRLLYAAVEADVLVEIIFLSNADQVGEDLLLAWILARPLAGTS